MSPRTFHAVPQPVERPSARLAAELGLPWRRPGTPRIVAGRREWIMLPALGVACMNAKLDTGARSSSLHAEAVEPDPTGQHVRFITHDHYGHRILCSAPVVRRTRVKNSSGETATRWFIKTDACIAGGLRWPILFSLADRSVMRCPVLLGRRALAGRFLVDPQAAHLLGNIRTLPAAPPCP
jgi:hypothetical protein